MKTRILTAVLSSTLVLAGAARLGAQATPSTQDDGSRLYTLNLVSQGYRDIADREKAFRESLTAAHYDVNRDGKLDAQEQAAWEKRLRSVLEANPKFMKQFDLNHNGVLSDAEWNAAYTEIFEIKASAPASSGGAD